MKIYRLHIDTDGTIENYKNITEVLAVEPRPIDHESKFGSSYDLWTYEVEEKDQDEYFDFINKFLDLLEPKFSDLESIGVTKDKILFWLLYEYDQQCGMAFHPDEMKRLGKNGIHLNIDCWQLSQENSTTA